MKASLALLTLAMLLGAAAPALAGNSQLVYPHTKVTATGTANSSSTSNSGAVAIGGGGGNATGGSAQASGGNSSIVFNNPGSTNNNTRIKQSGSLDTTPSVGGVGLGAAGVETCYGPGVGGGLAVTGFGANFAAATFDSDCNARLYSRTLFAMGHKNAALQLLINESPMVQRAFGVGQGGAAVTNRGLVYAQPVNGGYGGGCKKWSGGATGVGTCLYY